MQPELITALAALGGAAVGGLTTVWATHRTNRAVAERERAQRLHDQRQHSYNQALDVAGKDVVDVGAAVAVMGDSSAAQTALEVGGPQARPLISC